MTRFELSGQNIETEIFEPLLPLIARFVLSVQIRNMCAILSIDIGKPTSAPRHTAGALASYDGRDIPDSRRCHRHSRGQPGTHPCVIEDDAPNDEHGTGDRQREKRHTDKRQPHAIPQPPTAILPISEAVICRRTEQQDRGCGDRHKRDGEYHLTHRINLREPGGERHGQQEREQDLYTRR